MKKQGKPTKVKNPLNPILTEALTEMSPEDLGKLKESSQGERSLSNPNGSTGRKVIPIERILACRKKGMTIKETALVCQCSETNIIKRCQELDLETLEDFNTTKVSMWDMVERKHLNKLLGADDKSNVADSIIAGTAHDKGRLIRGQATEIVDHRIMTIDLNKAIEQLRAEQGRDSERQVEGNPDVIECPPVDN